MNEELGTLADMAKGFAISFLFWAAVIGILLGLGVV